MSSGKRKNKNKNKNKKRDNHPAVKAASSDKKRMNYTTQKSGSDVGGINNYAAAAPGILMCFITVFMLFADLATSDPQKQYDLYPALFRYIDVLIIAAGLACLFLMLTHNGGRHLILERLRRERSWIFFVLFLLFALISTCINGLDSAAMQGLPYRNIGVFNTFAFILIYMGASSCLNSEKIRQAIIVLFSAVSDMIAVSAVYDIYVGDIVSYHSKKELSVIFFNGNHYGYFLAMAVLSGIGMIIFTDGWKAVFGALTSILNLLVLGINHTLGCIIAVIVVTVVTIVFVAIIDPLRRKRVAVVGATVLILFTVALIFMAEFRSEFSGAVKDFVSILMGNAKGSEGHNRLKVWTRTWKYITEKPVFGYGCEGISERLYVAFAISNPHNEILTYAAYYGIPAAIAYTAGVISVLINSMRKTLISYPGICIACMAAAGYFISSLTGVAMFYLTPFFFILLGIGNSK